MYDVDDLNANLIENVRNAAVRQIRFVRMNGRKRACKFNGVYGLAGGVTGSRHLSFM